MRKLNLHPGSDPRGLRSRAARLFARRGVGEQQTFAPLLDAKAAGRLLGVPASWLLAQARAGRVPHHRLGHYVRFSSDDLRQWLGENRIAPDSTRNGASPARF